jgi:hypothetical protein
MSMVSELLSSHDVDVRRARTDLIDDPPTPWGAGWTAALRIPEGHPFFFDHPLDHVPGILTLFGLFDLINAATPKRPDWCTGRLTAELAFPGMCVLDKAVMLSVIPDAKDADRYLLRAAQGDLTGCDGWLRIVGDTGFTGPPHGLNTARHTPCRPGLVNRVRRDNVLLGSPLGQETIVASLVHPPAGHYLAEGWYQEYSVRRIIEAGRQFSTMILHHAAGKTQDCRFIWLGVRIDLPCAPAGKVTALRWRRERLVGNRVTVTAELVGNPATAVSGSVSYTVVTVSPAAYERFRLAGTGREKTP